MFPTVNKANLSIAGLYAFNPEVFSLMELPTGVDRETVIHNILLECEQLCLLYPDYDFMKSALGYWSASQLPTWERVQKLTELEYNPIENYDRYENEAAQEDNRSNRSRNENRSNTGRSNAASQEHSEGTSNTTTNNLEKVAGYNTTTLDTQRGNDSTNAANSAGNNTQASQVESTGTETTTGSDNGQENRNRARQLHIHGNIGVTTTAQMMEGELGVYPKINVVDYIVRAFKSRFCILVY